MYVCVTLRVMARDEESVTAQPGALVCEHVAAVSACIIRDHEAIIRDVGHVIIPNIPTASTASSPTNVGVFEQLACFGARSGAQVQDLVTRLQVQQQCRHH